MGGIVIPHKIKYKQSKNKRILIQNNNYILKKQLLHYCYIYLFYNLLHLFLNFLKKKRYKSITT